MTPLVALILGIASVFYSLVSIYKVYLVYQALGHEYELDITPDEVAEIDERTLPVYTILVPLYKEAEVIPRLAAGMAGLDYPLLETPQEWCVHGFSYPNYLEALGKEAQSEIYKKSSIDLALRDAFRKMRRFLMTTRGLSEDEAISLLSVGVDFGISQVVDGNFGVHAIVRKDIFAARDR